ncbi:MAG TPA: apolipoprotein N-acyltransferase [Candidatus Baltobacteraceae bacterium]|nr:apolipoprotein N-acyltransferase [Candidatus Baltobacteraceae bacterium]
MNESAQSTNISLRNISTSVRAAEWAVAMLSAIALALAFPKTQQAWLAPLGAAGLFWTWERLSWKRAFFAAWFAGAIFFSINFSWFTHTVGSYVGRLAFAVVLIPALIEALAFALTAVCTKIAFRFAPAWLAPIAGAAAFTIFEWLRSIDVTAVPFAQIGYSQTSTPLAVFAAYVGSFGVTFVVMLLGGYIAYAISRRRAAPLAIVVAVVAAGWYAAYSAWPARHAAPPTLRVAAVQGNIAQTIKWNKETLPRSVERYTALTQKLAPLHPQLVVWPETVITTDLDDQPYFWDLPALSPAQRSAVQAYLDTGARLRTQFANLARQLHTTLVVGSLDRHYGPEGLKEYNALYTFGPSGLLLNIYDKRQLVPFAESLPAPALFSWIPDASLIGRFGHGMQNTVIPADGMRFAPLICWESAFPDLIHAQIENGAQFLVIPTDDAWFGKSSGTYQHAQIAQMRAIETGEWVLQSASTGISGIISPSGAWTQATQLDKEAVLVGNIGLPPGSLFARIGPNPVIYALAALYVAVLLIGVVLRRA